MKFPYPWVVKPSIGNPAIVAPEGSDTTFDVLLTASYTENRESLQESLEGRIRLVRVGDENEDYALNIRGNQEVFNAETIEEALNKLESSQASKFIGWHLISSGAFPLPVKFFLFTLSFKDQGNIPKVPEEGSLLFSLKVGEHIKPNSICLTNKDWRDLTFIHATDLHVAKRNDDIPKTIGLEGNSSYTNFNDHLRELISRANKMAEEKGPDFMILTGDLIDYIKIELSDKIKGFDFDETNWSTFYSILTGLRVPAFTLLGNHDYRLNPYNLDDGGDRWVDFGLSESQFKQYRDKGVEADTEFPEQLRVSLPGLSWYFRCINADLDYEFSLGSHRFICLDTGPDEFDAEDANLLSEKIKKFVPLAEGLTTKVLKHGLKYGFFRWTLPWFLLGLFLGIISFVYLQIMNFKLLFSISISLAVFLVAWFIIPLIRAINIARGSEKVLLYDLGTLALAIEGIAPGSGPDSAGLSFEQIDWIRDVMKDKKKDEGLLFVCMHTPPVNASPDVDLAEFNEAGQRGRSLKPGEKLKYWIDKVEDANLSIGSIYRNWAEFLDFLAGIMGGKTVDLVLCGHAHQNVEFRVESYSSPVGSPARLSKKKVGICTDVYSDYINNPKGQPDWWKWDKSHPLTLVIQTTSLGPKGRNVTTERVEKDVAGYRIIEVKGNSIIRIEPKRV